MRVFYVKVFIDASNKGVNMKVAKQYKSLSTIYFTVLILIVSMSGCAYYSSKEVPIKPISEYQYSQSQGELTVVVDPFNAEKSKMAFGMDLNTARMLPLNLIIKNDGDKVFQITPKQVSGITKDGKQITPLDAEKVSDNISNATFGTGCCIGSSIGGILGGLVGGLIFSSYDLGFSKGFAYGLLPGMLGGLSYPFEVDTPRIKKNIENRSLKEGPVLPKGIISGLLFMPPDDYQQIGIAIEDTETKKPIIFSIKIALP